jgi:hypothetical protein
VALATENVEHKISIPNSHQTYAEPALKQMRTELQTTLCVLRIWKLTSGVMDDRGLGKHSVVLDFRLAERGAVVADDDKLALAGPQRLEGALVTQSVLPRLHHQRQARIDVLCLGFILLRHSDAVMLVRKELVEHAHFFFVPRQGV